MRAMASVRKCLFPVLSVHLIATLLYSNSHCMWQHYMKPSSRSGKMSWGRRRHSWRSLGRTAPAAASLVLLRAISTQTWLRQLPSPKPEPSPAPESGLGCPCRRRKRGGATGQRAGTWWAWLGEGGHRCLQGQQWRRWRRRVSLQGALPAGLLSSWQCFPVKSWLTQP